MRDVLHVSLPHQELVVATISAASTSSSLTTMHKLLPGNFQMNLIPLTLRKAYEKSMRGLLDDIVTRIVQLVC
jgi:hypothetical protein